jgi:FkbM family methyltransferase
MNTRPAFKRLLGKFLLGISEHVPSAKPFLKRWGLRTSPEWFPNRVVHVQARRAAGFKLASVGENYLSFELFWRGVDYYEPITTGLIRELVGGADTFVDVGANIGFYSLVASVCHPRLNVIAFEPNPKNFRLLRANAEANRLDRLVCEPAALSDSEGTAALYLSPSDMSASLESDFESRPSQAIEVRRTTLDDYLATRPAPGRLVLKVDVEGHESAVMEGAEQTIAKHRPDIILEVTEPLDREPAAFLKRAGYGFYQITDAGLLRAEHLTLVVRGRFLFLNYLLSARPARQVAELFERIEPRVRKLDLKSTSKFVAPEMLERLQARQTATVRERSSVV